jgi:hypothetical protein
MMKIVMLFLLCAALLHAQDQPSPGLWPHPYVFAYQPISYVLGAGVQNEYEYGFWGFEGIFDGSHKVNDNT